MMYDFGGGNFTFILRLFLCCRPCWRLCGLISKNLRMPFVLEPRRMDG